MFFTRFDNMLAVTNGMDLEDHRKIQKSIGNRYPITVSMGVGAAETPYDAQRNASRLFRVMEVPSQRRGRRSLPLTVLWMRVTCR